MRHGQRIAAKQLQIGVQVSYRVKIDSFEGPFELLLALVTQHKVKIGSISVSEVADQYIAYIEQMQDLDMDVASEFLVVASTLLAIKSRSLLPVEKSDDGDDESELGELTVEQATNLLVARIITYYQYKRLAAMLGSRMQNESMMHPRTAGPDPDFLGLLPDYLENVSLEGLGLVCATLMARRETILLDAEHIAAKPIAIESFISTVTVRLEQKRHMTFDELTSDAGDNAHVVGSFLAILEMYKRGMVELLQNSPKDPITIDYRDPDTWAQYALSGEGADAEGDAQPGEGADASADDGKDHENDDVSEEAR